MNVLYAILCVTGLCNMMTSSNENISTLMAFCEGTNPVTRSFDFFYDVRLNKR